MTVHFLQPDTSEIFLMDLSSGKFVRESITGARVPSKFATSQTPDGNIFMVGGCRMNQGKVEPIRSCIRINE